MSDPAFAVRVARSLGPGLREAPMAHAAHAPKLHTGPIHSPVAGRTDHLPVHVPDKAYVLPADIVSGFGEGNSVAGFRIAKDVGAQLKRVYGGMPYAGSGTPYGGNDGPYGQKIGHASGGSASGVPCALAGGEHVMTPQEVAWAGDGDPEAGTKALDAFVLQQRAQLVKTLKKLPGPKRD